MSNIEVIGAGLGRTGTHTMKSALNILGYKTYHMIEAIQNPLRRDYHMWAPMIRGEPVDEALVQQVLGTYTATMDQPASNAYKELLRRNPKAKVVLTVRDPEKWYHSCTQTIFQVETFQQNAWVLWIFPTMRYIRDGIANSVSKPFYGGHQNYKNKEYCIKLFKAHVEEVKKVVPADQLLIFEVKEGWEPLCKFLGKPIPEVPFPRENDTAEFQRNIRGMYITDRVLTAVFVAALAAGVYFVKEHFF